MTPNEAATVPTEPATLHTVRSTAAPAHRPTAALNSTATNVSAETSIQTANSTSTWNAPPTPRNRFAKRSGPDWAIEVGIEQRHLDAHTAASDRRGGRRAHAIVPHPHVV